MLSELAKKILIAARRKPCPFALIDIRQIASVYEFKAGEVVFSDQFSKEELEAVLTELLRVGLIMEYATGEPPVGARWYIQTSEGLKWAGQMMKESDEK